MKIQLRVELVKLLDEYKLPKTAVECGVAEGRFSLELVQAGIEKLYLVDIWENIPMATGCAGFDQDWHIFNYLAVRKLFLDNDKVVILKGLSSEVCKEVPDKSLGLAYLDADHSYESVMEDLKIWWPKLVDGGIMAGHDFGNPTYGVRKAVEEFTKDKYKVHTIEENGNIENLGFWFQKK